MHTQTIGPRWLLALVALLLTVIGVTSVSAHASLKSSIPAAGSTVSTAPTSVVAVFDNHDALQAVGSVLTVTDARGQTVDKGDATLDKRDPERKTMVVSLNAALENGSYTVNWTAVSSADGSKEEGSFTFTVQPGAAPSAPQAMLPATGADSFTFALLLGGGAVLICLGLMLRRRVTS